MPVSVRFTLNTVEKLVSYFEARSPKKNLGQLS